jgi:hypothetical protein
MSVVYLDTDGIFMPITFVAMCEEHQSKELLDIFRKRQQLRYIFRSTKKIVKEKLPTQYCLLVVEIGPVNHYQITSYFHVLSDRSSASLMGFRTYESSTSTEMVVKYSEAG